MWLTIVSFFTILVLIDTGEKDKKGIKTYRFNVKVFSTFVAQQNFQLEDFCSWQKLKYSKGNRKVECSHKLSEKSTGRKQMNKNWQMCNNIPHTDVARLCFPASESITRLSANETFVCQTSLWIPPEERSESWVSLNWDSVHMLVCASAALNTVNKPLSP